jgi:hypothetical protein
MFGCFFPVSRAEDPFYDDEDVDTEDGEDDFLLLHERPWTPREESEWRERRDQRRRRQRQQQDDVVELGLPMAVLVPDAMSVNGGPSADTALKKVRADRKCCYCCCCIFLQACASCKFHLVRMCGGTVLCQLSVNAVGLS